MSIESNSEQTRICQQIVILFQFRKVGNRTKLDGKAEIEEKKDGNSEMLPFLRTPP